MLRKLASIQKIEEVSPIDGADFIERARVLGWSMVVKRGEFKPNDMCVFFEIDSILPDKPIFEFMRKHKFRVRSVKMKMTLAQGLALPLSAFPELTGALAIGDDVTEQLGVTKYEHPESVSTGGIAKGVFPFYVPKTDEMRIQSVPDLLTEMAGVECYVAVKMDGTSSTFVHRDGEVDVCGRNLSFKENEDNAMWKIERKYNLIAKLKTLGNFALQGEVCGPGIQSNRAGLKSISFFAFNLYDINNTKYVDSAQFFKFCEENDIPTVPRLPNVTINHSIEQLLELAKGDYATTTHPQEGIVIRPVVERLSNVLRSRMSFKVINNDFLLKTGQ